MRLQRAIKKYGLSNFSFNVLEFAPYLKPAILELETAYMSSFHSSILYNFATVATSQLGYKHTLEAIEKMKARFANPANHPMYGKTHTPYSRALISQAVSGSKNPMYGKTQSPTTRAMISMKMGNPVNLCTRNGAILREFPNGDGALGFYLGINKTTVGRYRAKNKL
ncbi:MAG: hypothetical protein EOO61_01525 [Hymenobacter sp.]|nr:MAG: hypothetical protein EOO61_01525 [Hymenobacter sp.]